MEDVLKKKIITFCAAVLFLTALGLTLYPLLSNYVNQKYASKIQTAYQVLIQQTDDSILQEAKQRAIAYNLAIIPGTADAYSEEALLSAAKNYDDQLDIAGNGIMGYVEIPKIQVNLPIYHGTEDPVLQVAIGHLEWSSLPVGGESTHCVLSGHRGLPSAKLFTNLDKLREGDIFLLRILDEVLTYEVDQILIVEPQEVEALQIVEGQDYCTLVTCTPYGINTHRLLVRGHRIDNVEEAKTVRVTADAVQIEPLLVAPIVAIPILLLLLILLLLPKRPKTKHGGDADEED